MDLIKLHLEPRINPRTLFFADQLAHLLVIAGVVYLYQPYSFDFGLLYSPKWLLLLTALISVTYVTSVIMRILVSKWDLTDVDSDSSLPNAGKYIGILERLFVTEYILIGTLLSFGFALIIAISYRHLLSLL